MECEVAEFYEYSEPVARKPYRCCECGTRIEVGERHFYGRGKWDGDFSTHRQHLDCMEACMLIRDHFNDECIPFGSLMREWYGEIRRDLDRRDHEPTRRLRALFAGILRRRRAARGK